MAKPAPAPTLLPLSELEAPLPPGWVELEGVLPPGAPVLELVPSGLVEVEVPLSALLSASLFLSGVPLFSSITAAVATVSKVVADSAATVTMPPAVTSSSREVPLWLAMVAEVSRSVTAMATEPAMPTLEAPAPAMAQVVMVLAGAASPRPKTLQMKPKRPLRMSERVLLTTVLQILMMPEMSPVKKVFILPRSKRSLTASAAMLSMSLSTSAPKLCRLKREPGTPSFWPMTLKTAPPRALAISALWLARVWGKFSQRASSFSMRVPWMRLEKPVSPTPLRKSSVICWAILVMYSTKRLRMSWSPSTFFLESSS